MKYYTQIREIESTIYKHFDGIIIPTRFASFAERYFNDAEVTEIIKNARNHGCDVVINVDQLLTESELPNFKEFIPQLEAWDSDYVMFSDWAVYQLASPQLRAKLVYSNSFALCSALDVLAYHDLGVKVVLSNEVNDYDLLENSKIGHDWVVGFGHLLMFYSRRPLLSLYETAYELELPNRHYRITEAKRTEEVPHHVTETPNGTFIHHGLVYNLGDAPFIKQFDVVILNSYFLTARQVIAAKQAMELGAWRSLALLFPLTTGFRHQTPEILDYEKA